jgi:hypothetical protein
LVAEFVLPEYDPGPIDVAEVQESDWAVTRGASAADNAIAIGAQSRRATINRVEDILSPLLVPRRTVPIQPNATR